MRSLSLLVGLVLASPVVYAQHAPVAATTAPAAHTTPASSPSPSSSSSNSSGPSHSASPGSSSSSSSTISSSSSSHSSSSSGMDSGSLNRHERERDSSRDSSQAGSHNSGSAASSSNSGTARGEDSSFRDLPVMRDSWGSPRDSAHEKKTDTSTSGRRDLDQDRIGRGQGQVNAPRIDPKIDSKIDSKIADPHDRDAAPGRTIDPATGGRRQIGRDPDYHPDAAGKGQKKCDKEPCASPAPQLSQSDWRLGRCQEGPCKPCPEGTSPTKYGNCVANARPAATAPAATAPAPPCPGGRVYGGSCIDEYATSRASASQCIYYRSEGNRISTDLASANQRERDECLKDSSSAECRFAQMAVSRARSSCSILETQTPVECHSSIPSCL